jgi:Holliday junction resolvasome RuvABC endonuclease subunit
MAEVEAARFRLGGCLALDLASVTGVAYSAGSDQPIYTSKRMGEKGCSIGECFLAFDAYLNRILDRLRPSVVIFEAPMLGRGSVMVAQRLMGLAAIAELIALKRGVPRVFRAESSTVAKSFTGRGRYPDSKAKKQAVIDTCKRYGWLPTDDNQADALALLHHAQSLFNREQLVARAAGPLFR